MSGRNLMEDDRLQVITTHINADFDALASMLAAKKLYPQARIVFPGSQERSLREFFVQSTFYLFEVDRIRDIDLERIGTLILVDTRQRSRIGRFAEVVDSPGVAVHIYDHHPPTDDDLEGEVQVVKELGATTTLMVQILRERGLEVTPDEATVLALGIYEDTGSLTFSSTRPEDFEAMAYLRSKGAKLSIVSDLITRELTADQVFLLNDLIRSARKVRVQGVEVVIATAASEHYVGDFAVLVHKLRDMENIDVLFALARMEDRVYLVARSRLESVNVGQIALGFGGGGHATAASATIRDLTLMQAEERLLALLKEMVRPVRSAREIMSFPVKTIYAEQKIKEAAEILARFNINVLPVMKGEELVGLISRVVVQKASYHGLEELPVKEYMTSDFDTVTPDVPVEEVRRIIVENAQRFVPVLEDGRLVGAITRTDILRELQFDGLETGEYAFDRVHKEEAVRKKKIRQMMEERLPPRILGLLSDLGDVAGEMGINAFVVGGFVRDLLLRQENLDLDVVVEGDAIEFSRSYAEARACRCRPHHEFGTAVLILPDGLKVDVATARTEYYEHPAALPTVELSSIKLDLYRRDFTINTLAVCLNPPHFGQLLDFFGGQRDIKDRTVRVLHNLSFVEDPTRVLRAVRFENRFGFKISKHTLNLIHSAVRLNFLEKVEGRRLWQELLMLLSEKRPLVAMQRLREFDVLRFIHPSLDLGEAKRRLFQEVEGVLAWYELLYLEDRVEPWRVYLLALLDEMSDEEVCQALERLAFPPREVQRWSAQKMAADRVLSRISSARGLRPSQVYAIMQPFRIETLLYLTAKAREHGAKRHLSQYITRYRGVNPMLNGEDLKALGMKPGPVFRRALDALRDARMDGKVTTREDEVDFVLRRFLPEGSRQRGHG
ncbi:MAG: CBS domain-containing protein [Thermodesulfobacteriota bacterium]